MLYPLSYGGGLILLGFFAPVFPDHQNSGRSPKLCLYFTSWTMPAAARWKGRGRLRDKSLLSPDANKAATGQKALPSPLNWFIFRACSAAAA